jgi:S1-C subfamily serine protease
MRTENWYEQLSWIVVYVLAALNLIVFSLLLLRFLLTWYEVPVLSRIWVPNPNVLLLDGLGQQRYRLEGILSGPCESPGMDQYQRGQIGPLIRGDVPAQSAPRAQNPEPGTGMEPVTPDRGSRTPVTPPGQSSTNEPEPAQTTPPADPQANQPSQSSSAQPPQAPDAPSLTGGDVLPPIKLRNLVDHSVVRVVALMGPEQMMTGTGFAISPDTIVTNRHVIEQVQEGQLFVASKYLGTEPVRARLLATTAGSQLGNSDFAVLQIENGKPLTSLNVGDDPQPLESVVAAGYPGLTTQTDSNDTIPDVVYSQGDVSVVQPQSNGTSLVIHTANISPGSSGGPLVNRCGTVVGVNTFVTTGRDEFTGRALYSLSGETLSDFLKSSSIPFNKPSATECALGDN